MITCSSEWGTALNDEYIVHAGTFPIDWQGLVKNPPFQTSSKAAVGRQYSRDSVFAVGSKEEGEVLGERETRKTKKNKKIKRRKKDKIQEPTANVNKMFGHLLSSQSINPHPPTYPPNLTHTETGSTVQNAARQQKIK